METKDIKQLHADAQQLRKVVAALNLHVTPADFEAAWVTWQDYAARGCELQSAYGLGTLARTSQKTLLQTAQSLLKEIKLALLEVGGKHKDGFAALPQNFQVFKGQYQGAVLSANGASHFFFFGVTLYVLLPRQDGWSFLQTTRVGPPSDWPPTFDILTAHQAYEAALAAAERDAP